MRKLQTAVFIVAVLFTAGAVLAQNDAPGGGLGGRRGGGRGGMDRNSVVGLLRIDEVKAELKITDDQQAKIQQAGEEVATSLPRPDVDFRALQDASPEERQAGMAKFREHREKVDKEIRGKLTGILDEAQMKRLQGLWIQRAGALAALNNEDVAAALKLNDDQKSKLTTQLADQPQLRFGGRRGGAEGGTPPGGGGGEGAGTFLEQMQAARKASDEKAVAVLTDEQKAQLDTLKGAKFDFPPPQSGGGRGGEGGGGRRGRDAL